jgi:hypothetical protein
MKSVSRTLYPLLVAFLLSACFWNDDVRTDQVGIVSDGGRLATNCLAPGIYSDAGFFTNLLEVPISTLTFEVSDTSVATQDTQIVGVTVAVQARRKSDCPSVQNLLTNWPSLLDDQVLITTVSATTSEAIKVGTRAMTLEQLLNDRNGLSTTIVDSLTPDAAKYSVEIINVSIKDIALDPAYEQKLRDKAAITVDIEIAQRQQALIETQAETDRIEQEQRNAVLAAQLTAEQAQTAIEVEVASREGEKIAAENQVYQDNERAYELARLNAWERILGDKATIYFVQPGMDFNLFLSGTPMPVVQTQNTTP